MKNNLLISIFVLVEVFVVSYILLTVNALPEQVASHFNNSGTPNGFMSNRGYLIFMIVFAIFIPASIVIRVMLEFNVVFRSINIPNKEYWLSDKNKGHTIQLLKNHIVILGILICLFIAYIHWLLIKANNVQPAQLLNSDFYLGFVTFILSILAWGIYLVVKFIRKPET